MAAPDVQGLPEDRTRSPRTGWGRAHWEAVADALLEGVAPHASPLGALYDLPGPRPSLAGRRSDGFEGFARTFLLAAFRIPHAPAPVRDRLVERYARGLAAGVRPGGPEAWPPLEDLSQSLVEAASVAIALHETRTWLWDALPAGVQADVVRYLADFLHCDTHPNNWVMFRVVVLTFLESVGGPTDRAGVDAALDRMDGWYLGQGWYTDGDRSGGRRFDHYNGWAMHFYPLLWSRMVGPDRAPERAAAYAERVGPYLHDLAHLVGADGSPVQQGRSMTYRAAVVAPVWAAELVGAGSLEPGLARRLCSGVLRSFVDAGVLDGGTLPLGWHAEHLPMVQPYSGPASPYWMSKAFAGLLLPPDHPAWTDVEADLPVERGDFARPVAVPGWLAQGTRADGVVRLLDHSAARPLAEREPGASWPDDPYYARLAYSSVTAPVTGCSDGTAVVRTPDGEVVLVAQDGRRWWRADASTTALAPGVLVSAHRLALADGEDPAPAAVPARAAELRLASVVEGAVEVRVLRVLGAEGSRLEVSGYALSDAVQVPAGQAGVAAAAAPDGAASQLVGLSAGLSASVEEHEPNALGASVRVPVLSSGPLSGDALVAVAVVLSGPPVDAAALRREVGVRVDGPLGSGSVVVTWPGGREDRVAL